MPIKNTVYSPKTHNQRNKKNLSNSIKHPAEKILEFEKVLFKILTKFSKLLINDYDKEIEEALKIVVDYLDFDRGTLAEFLEREDTLKVMLFYAKPGVPKPYISNISLEMPDYTSNIKKGKVHLRPAVEAGSDNEGSEKLYVLEEKHARRTNLKTHIGLPVKVGDSFIGALTFDVYREERCWSEDLITKLELLSEIFGNVVERKRSHERHQHIAELGDLVSSISIKFLDLSSEKFDVEIENSMKRIADYIGAERVRLYQYSNKNTKKSLLFKLSHHWSNLNNVINPMELNQTDFPWCFKQLKKGKILLISHVDEFPKSALVDRQSMINSGCKSFMAIPLFIPNRVNGLLCFDNILVEKKWATDTIPKAKVISQIFSNILSRKNTDMELHSAYKEIKHLKEKAENENVYLRKEIELINPSKEILGHSNNILNILDQARKVAKTNSTVLILGETGTGKDLFAREIHRVSLRKDHPLITVNCAALSSTLIESELFGHEKGAFTGAEKRKIGRFEIAHGSTIFLDEIGEMPLDSQSKLLRILQEGKFERVGSTKSIEVDVRVIAATNRNLSEDVRNGKFREDLYYRLKVFPIWIPPLRDRVEDIPELTLHFIDEFSRTMGKKVDNVPKKSMKMLQRDLWPGNVRELKNVIEYAMILSNGQTLNIQIPQRNASESPVINSMEEIERRHILKILNYTGWRVKGNRGAAEILQMKPSTLFSRMKKLDISNKTNIE